MRTKKRTCNRKIFKQSAITWCTNEYTKTMLKSKNEGNTKIYIRTGITVRSGGYTNAIETVQETIVPRGKGKEETILLLQRYRSRNLGTFLTKIVMNIARTLIITVKYIYMCVSLYKCVTMCAYIDNNGLYENKRYELKTRKL